LLALRGGVFVAVDEDHLAVFPFFHDDFAEAWNTVLSIYYIARLHFYNFMVILSNVFFIIFQFSDPRTAVLSKLTSYFMRFQLLFPLLIMDKVLKGNWLPAGRAAF